MNLREELGVAKNPDFDLELPRGWARFDVNKDAHEVLLEGLKRRYQEAHRPDLFAEAKATLENTFEKMANNGVFAFFAPAASAEQYGTAIPASLNASIRSSEPGRPLDKFAEEIIRNFGAQPLLGDPRTLRFERESLTALGGEMIVSHSLIYLTPVPGTRRRRALQLVAGFARTQDVPPDAPAMEKTRNLFDACVASLTWRGTPRGNSNSISRKG